MKTKCVIPRSCRSRRNVSAKSEDTVAPKPSNASNRRENIAEYTAARHGGDKTKGRRKVTLRGHSTMSAGVEADSTLDASSQALNDAAIVAVIDEQITEMDEEVMLTEDSEEQELKMDEGTMPAGEPEIWACKCSLP